MAEEQLDLTSERLSRLWWDGKDPVLLRRPRPKPLMLRLPFSYGNGTWVRHDHRSKPKWNKPWECWDTPVAWLDDLVTRSLKKYGRIYIVQPVSKLQKCAPACWNAQGYECECSCMGINHGNGEPHGNWKEISESLAVTVGKREFSCRLVTPKGFSQETQ